MKQLMLLYILFLFSCSDGDNVVITKLEYKKLTGDTLAPKYPKKVYVPSNTRDNASYFEVWLGSDGHEYQQHKESHVPNQWVHYVGCKKCI
jgi:hypothetical protein